MNRMVRHHRMRNRENNDDAAAFRRLAMFHRQQARDANPRGNALDLIMAPFANVQAAVGGIREARHERVTVNGSTLRYRQSFILPSHGGWVDCEDCLKRL